jgi:hypothetical protein
VIVLLVRTPKSKNDSKEVHFVHKMSAMNDQDLNRMLKHAATAGPAAMPPRLEDEIMARVRVDDGRMRRWRSFVHWLLILAAGAGILTAGVIGWSLALRDKTHTTPPAMNLVREGAAP